MPLHVRGGAIIPMGPIRQYADERVDAPLALSVYPGADGSFRLYEDDGRSFAYRRGAWMGIDMAWRDAARRLTLRLAPGSRMLPPVRRALEVRIVGGQVTRTVVFGGKPVEITL
jgi:alpha-glucosidase (family GH31 glycosyl hydrolase)